MLVHHYICFIDYADMLFLWVLIVCVCVIVSARLVLSYPAYITVYFKLICHTSLKVYIFTGSDDLINEGISFSAHFKVHLKH